jgi:hypothetical protein
MAFVAAAFGKFASSGTNNGAPANHFINVRRFIVLPLVVGHVDGMVDTDACDLDWRAPYSPAVCLLSVSG